MDLGGRVSLALVVERHYGNTRAPKKRLRTPLPGARRRAKGPEPLHKITK